MFKQETRIKKLNTSIRSNNKHNNTFIACDTFKTSNAIYYYFKCLNSQHVL